MQDGCVLVENRFVPDVDSAVARALSSEDVVETIFRHAEVVHGRLARPCATLVRALRHRLVCSTWCRAAANHVRRARALDICGMDPSCVCERHASVAPPVGLDNISRLTEVRLDGCASQPDFTSLVRLHTCSLRGSSLSDASLAAALHSVPPDCCLRALELGGCSLVGEQVLKALSERHARTLMTLDLSGCRPALRRPLQLEALFRRCSRLQLLDLSRCDASCAVLGSVLLYLSTTLTTLLLDCTALTADDFVPSEAGNGAVTWQRMTRLSTLSLADNPRLSASAVAAVVAQLPALTSLELSGADFWREEVHALVHVLRESSRLAWLGCTDCEHWMSPEIVRTLHGRDHGGVGRAAGPHLTIVYDPSKLCERPWDRLPREAGGLPAAQSAMAHADAPESWEELAHQLDEAGASAVLPALSLMALKPTTAPTARVQPQLPAHLVDLSRPPQYRQRARSIYHISTGDQPYYGDGRDRSGPAGDALCFLADRL